MKRIVKYALYGLIGYFLGGMLFNILAPVGSSPFGFLLILGLLTCGVIGWLTYAVRENP